MNHNYAIGDFVTRPKLLGFVSHIGVILGPNSILQNNRQKGEHVSTLEEFAEGEQIQVKRTGANAASVLTRVRMILRKAKPYDAVARNCEHTANEAVYGKAVSPQLVFV